MVPWFRRVWRSWHSRHGRKQGRYPPALEDLEARWQPSNIIEYPVTPNGATPTGIASGSDGNLWFTAGNIAAVDSITTTGAVTQHPTPAGGSQPEGITAGPDGALWFTELQKNKIGRVTTAGAFTEYTVPTAGGQPTGITAGPDGALWFTEFNTNKVGRLTTTGGAFTEYTVPTAGGQPDGITTGPDGALWFTEYNRGQIGRLDPATGAVTEYPTSKGDSQPAGIVAGPDGALWFTEKNKGLIGRMTTAGALTEYATSAGDTQPDGITAGPDGALWFTEYNKSQIGRITTGGALTEIATPTSNSKPDGITAGPDGSIWFTESQATQVGKVPLATDLPLTAAGTSVAATEGLTFNGAVATFRDADATAVAGDFTATIYWGDGTSSAGTVSGAGPFTISGSHAYAEDGSDTITVAIQDGGGAFASAVSPATVGDAPLRAAGLAVIYGATEGQGTGPQVVAQFTDPGSDGTAADYAATITWGDGGTSAGTVSLLGGTTFQVAGSHTYAEDGSDTVSVTITDKGGAPPLTVSSTIFSVADAALSPTGSPGTYAAAEGAGTGPQAVAQFTDPGTDGTAADYSAVIAWGDGTSGPGTVSLVAGTTFQVAGSHTYAEEGSFPVSVTVTDKGGAPPLVVSNAAFSVGDAPLSAAGPALSYGATEGQGTGPQVVAQFTDPGTDGTAADYAATITWGDGSTSSGTVSLLAGTTFQVVGSHTYAEEGSFPVSVTVTDKGGAPPLAVSNATFSVADAPLSAAGAPAGYSAVEGADGGARVLAQFSDPAGNGSAADYSAVIAWGDGTRSAGAVSPLAGNNFQVLGAHTYAEDGSFPVAVTIQDVGGAPPLVVNSVTFGVAEAPLSAAGTSAVVSTTPGADSGPLVLAQFTDPAGDGTAADYAATIAWGDGSTSAGTVTLAGGHTFRVVGDHSYAVAGLYPAAVTIQDVGAPPPLVVNSITFSVAALPTQTAPPSTGATPAPPPSAPATTSLPPAPPATAPPIGPVGHAAPVAPSQSPVLAGSPQAPPSRAEGLPLPFVADASPPPTSSGEVRGNGPTFDAGAVVMTVTALNRPTADGGSGLGGGGGEGGAAQGADRLAQAETAEAVLTAPDVAAAKSNPGSAPVAAAKGAPPPGDSRTTAVAAPPQPAAVPPAVTTNHFRKALLWQRLDKVGDDLAQGAGARKVASVGLTSVALATAGYVLLSGRAGSWLLSALTSQPLWQEYDPLAVLLAREKERQRARGPRPDEDEETLQSLVG